jgi:hypothetical protein
MVAGCCGWLSIYPLDVLRSRIMSTAPVALASSADLGASELRGSTSHPPRAAAADAPAIDAARARAVGARVGAQPASIVAMVSAAARETYAAGGLRGFYRGISFTLLRAAPVAGTVLPVYDAGKAWLAGRM